MISVDFHILVTSTPPTGFVVPALVSPSPRVVNGDLIITTQNLINGGPQLLRLNIFYHHTYVS